MYAGGDPINSVDWYGLCKDHISNLKYGHAKLYAVYSKDRNIDIVERPTAKDFTDALHAGYDKVILQTHGGPTGGATV